MPLYRYQLRLRLARALDLLAQYDDLTTLGLDLGFSSHSHFSAAFRAGLRPHAVGVQADGLHALTSAPVDRIAKDFDSAPASGVVIPRRPACRRHDGER